MQAVTLRNERCLIGDAVHDRLVALLRRQRAEMARLLALKDERDAELARLRRELAEERAQAAAVFRAPRAGVD